FPTTRADAAELRFRFAQADIAADQMRFLQRHVQGHLVVELERDHLAEALRGIELGQPAIERDAVLEVHDEVAFHQLGEIEQLIDLRALWVARKLSEGRRCRWRPKISVSVTTTRPAELADNVGQGRAGPLGPPGSSDAEG